MLTATVPLDHAHIDAQHLHDRIVEAASADQPQLSTGIENAGFRAGALAAGLRKALRTHGSTARTHLNSAIAFLDAAAADAADAAYSTGNDVHDHISRMIAATRSAVVELGLARSSG
ncbi:MAG TPA: hypothetical protein VGN14_09865 [Candidatus Elarobacter sp.]|jgi:hypothetical protein